MWTGLAGELPDDGQLEDQVGAQHPQLALGGMVVQMAIWVIIESMAIVPEWLATSSAPPLSGMFSSPRVSTRNHCS